MTLYIINVGSGHMSILCLRLVRKLDLDSFLNHGLKLRGGAEETGLVGVK
jgi:hypothetical protein